MDQMLFQSEGIIYLDDIETLHNLRNDLFSLSLKKKQINKQIYNKLENFIDRKYFIYTDLKKKC